MEATQQAKAEDFRARQRRDWDEASQGWRDWHELIDRAADHVSEHIVRMARVQPGDRVLDIAAGYGEPALTAAKVVGPRGEVVATDISASMLAYGRERASAAGLENVRFVESDAFSIPSRPRCSASAGRRSQTPSARASDDGSVRLSNLVLVAAARA